MADVASSDRREGGLAPAHPSNEQVSVPGSAQASLEHTDRGVADAIARLDELRIEELCLQWRNLLGGTAPRHLPRWLMARLLAHRVQVQVQGDLAPSIPRLLKEHDRRKGPDDSKPFQSRPAALREGGTLRPGSILTREWQGTLEQVMVLDRGFAWQGRTYASLSAIAKAMTGTSWNGHRFFGLARHAPSPAKRAARSSRRPTSEDGR